MRILEIGKFYPPQRGGMERSLEALCRGLARRGHDLRVLVAAEGEDGREEWVDDVRVCRLPNWGQVRSVPVVPSLFSRVRRELRDFAPDVVHLHLPHPLGVFAWRWFGGGAPLLVTYHSDIVRQRWLARLVAFDRRRLLTGAAAIHVSSAALREESRDLRPVRERCRVIPFGIDTERYRDPDPVRVQRWNDRVGPRFVLFVGRLVYYKGLDVLLEAMRELSMPLVVAGDGPMREEWQTLSRVLGLGDRVHFVGDVSEESLRALYHAATVFAFPSTERAETFGLVQLEAMASGLPVVAARASGGVVSVHEEGRTALLVPPRDAGALREALVRVWQEEDLARGLAQEALQRVRGFFDQERSLDHFEDLLASVASR